MNQYRDLYRDNSNIDSPKQQIKSSFQYYEKVLYNQWFLREFNYLIMVLDAFIKELYCTDKQFITQMYIELVNARKPFLDIKNIEWFVEDFRYIFYMNHLLELCKNIENEFLLTYVNLNFFKNNKNVSNQQIYLQTKQKLQVKYEKSKFILINDVPNIFEFLEKNIYDFINYRNFILNKISE